MPREHFRIARMHRHRSVLMPSGDVAGWMVKGQDRYTIHGSYRNWGILFSFFQASKSRKSKWIWSWRNFHSPESCWLPTNTQSQIACWKYSWRNMSCKNAWNPQINLSSNMFFFTVLFGHLIDWSWNPLMFVLQLMRRIAFWIHTDEWEYTVESLIHGYFSFFSNILICIYTP